MPTLVGIGWELYIAMPLRYGSKSYTPVLHFWEAWYVFSYTARRQLMI